MFPYLYYVLGCVISVSATLQYDDNVPNFLELDATTTESEANDLALWIKYKLRLSQELERRQEQVKIQLYYECLCPDCRLFDTKSLAPAVEKLGKYLDLHLYPYGNARTTIHEDGRVEINCQHGPAECYGNMLHACAIEKINNITKAVLFNSCMMESSQKNKGSDDKAADKCGNRMEINTSSIKSCAKGPEGMQLLQHYGEESKKVTYPGVPYILINGVENSGDNFFRDVCEAFRTPPQECNEIYQTYSNIIFG